MIMDFSTSKKNDIAGYTLLELLVVIAIAALIVTITALAFLGLSSSQSLEKDTDVAQSYLEKARLQAVNSNNFSEFGIKVATTSITIFQGTSFATATSTSVYNLSPKVQVKTISLSNNGTEFYFNKITGEPNATGTITFTLTNASSTKSIVIYGTGLSETQ